MTEGVKFFQLPPETVPTLWHLLRPRLLSAIERSSGRLTEKDTFHLLTTGGWQCWTAWDDQNKCEAVVITKIERQGSGLKSLQAIIATGDNRHHWQLVAEETLERFAAVEGCELFEMLARPGWERVFTPDRGWKKTHVMLEKQINVQ